MAFYTESGQKVAAVTEAQMREVDRVAEEVFGLSVLQMMENAGRNLAAHVMLLLSSSSRAVTVLAGAGGNGGGGLCCARHLHNRGFDVSIVLDRDSESLTGAAGKQLRILHAAGIEPLDFAEAKDAIERAQVVIDAIISRPQRGILSEKP